ncbi:unnamed protein product, partial [Dicrocoelium dendriticum]
MMLFPSCSLYRFRTLHDLGQHICQFSDKKLASYPKSLLNLFFDTLILFGLSTNSNSLPFDVFHHKNRRSLVQSNLSSPTSLALDFIRNELFWTDGERGSVEAYHLRTRHRRTVLQSDSLHPVDIAVFEDWVYWTDRKKNHYMRANKFNGRYVEPMFNISSPHIFRLQHDLLRPPFTDRCPGYMCEQLCIPVPLRSYPAYTLPYECACADGWEVNRTDAHRCVGNNTEESFTSW